MDPQIPANPLMPFIPYLLMFFIFYVLVIRPRNKEQDGHKKKLEGLKKNDVVVTAGGIHGTVVNVKEKTVVLRVDDSVKMEFDKTAISRVENG